MSIYVKGMEMPSCCLHCDFANEFGDCCCKDTEPYECEFDKPDSRPDWCPLVELPEHGDLIDVELLLEGILGIAFQHGDNPDKVAINTNALLQLIDSLPTIIPADGGGA